MGSCGSQRCIRQSIQNSPASNSSGACSTTGPAGALAIGIESHPDEIAVRLAFERIHTFARAFLQNGGDVFSLLRILGHSPRSLQVTRRYVDLLDDDPRAVHRAASPVDRLT